MKNGPIERKGNIFPIGLSKERCWKARYGILDGRDQFPTVQGTIVGLPSSYQATAVTIGFALEMTITFSAVS